MDSPIYHLSSVVKDKSEALQDFTGPLDLILYLLNKNKMEIKDIQISLILGQYLQWMEQQTQIDLEVASEFVTMASHLVDIKTRMLLSIHDVEASSEMEELIASLEQHRNKETYLRVKKITAYLQLQQRHGQNFCVKAPEQLEQANEQDYDHKPRDLWRAMQAILNRAQVKKPVEMVAFEKIVGREPYPVAKKAQELIHFLIQHGASGFAALLACCETRTELVATFIALLDLCKNNRLHISEDEDFIVQCLDDSPLEEPLPSEDSLELADPDTTNQ